MCMYEGPVTANHAGSLWRAPPPPTCYELSYAFRTECTGETPRKISPQCQRKKKICEFSLDMSYILMSQTQSERPCAWRRVTAYLQITALTVCLLMVNISLLDFFFWQKHHRDSRQKKNNNLSQSAQSCFFMYIIWPLESST